MESGTKFTLIHTTTMLNPRSDETLADGMNALQKQVTTHFEQKNLNLNLLGLEPILVVKENDHQYMVTWKIYYEESISEHASVD